MNTPHYCSTHQSSISIKKRRKRVLLGITGSVAAIKGPELALQLSKELDAHVAILLTHGGENFWFKAEDYNPQKWNEYYDFVANGTAKSNDDDHHTQAVSSLPQDDDPRSIVMFRAQDEWKGWQKMSDPVLHIQLRDWADLAVIAPLSAHTMAKIANGLCDETLSCVLRAWDFGYTTRKGKPLLLAPAMNTAMWEHPLTRSQLETIQGFWNSERSGDCLIWTAKPQVKALACGEIGTGAMASVDYIVQMSQELIADLGN